MKKLKILFYLTLLFAIITEVAVLSETAYAKNNIISLKRNKVCQSYDVTNDGKADKVEISYKKEKYYCSGFTIFINDKTALDLSDQTFYEEWGDICSLIRLKNGKAFFYVYLGCDNGDGPMNLYTWENGSLKSSNDLLKYLDPIGYHSSFGIKKVTGNKIIAEAYSMSHLLGAMNFEITYKYNKSGKMAESGKIHKVTSYSTNNGKELTVNRKLQLYKDKGTKSKKGALKKGMKVKVTHIYVNGKTVSYKVNGKNVSGWIKSLSSYSVGLDSKVFSEVQYAG